MVRHWILIAVLVTTPCAWGAESLTSSSAVISPLQLKRMNVEELLEQQIVSVSRKPETLGEAAGNIFLIRGEAGRLTGAVSLPQLLRLAPNLFVAQANAYDWAISTRGFLRADARANKLLVTIDGRTVYSPLFSGVFWDTQDVFLPDLQDIEVVSGPGGSTWGANAVSGVISIKTKSAAETHGGLVYAGLATPTSSHAGARYGARFGTLAHYRVYAKHTDHASTLAANGADDRADAWATTQAGFRIDGDTLNDTHYTVQGDVYAARYDRPGLARSENDGANLLARWTRDYGDDSAYSVQFYHDYTRRFVPGGLNDRLHISDLELQHRRWLSERHELVAGFNYRLIHDHARFASGAAAFIPAAKDLGLAGFYVQNAVRLRDDRLRLTSGLRVEHNEYSGWEFQPSVKLAWLPHPNQTLWVSASRSTRTPSRVDTEFSVPAQPPFLLVGGADFKSEVLFASEAGWRSRPRSDLALTLVAFHHDFNRLRSLEGSGPVTLGNGVKGESYGLEYFLDWDVTPRLRTRVGGFLQRQRTWLAPGSLDLEGGLAELSYPDFQVHFRQGYQFTDNLGLVINVRHVGAVPAFGNGMDRGAVPAYTELDASIRWMFRPGVEWSLTGRNLLDGAHPEFGTASARREIERSLQSVIRWEF